AVFFTASQNLASEDPHFDADYAVGRARLGESVGHVGSQGLQRHASFPVPLHARDLGSAQASCHVNLDALCAHAHRAHDGLLHRPAEGDAPLELQRDILGNELRIKVGAANLVYIDECLFAFHQFLDVALELVDLGALLADNNSGPRGMDIELGL